MYSNTFIDTTVPADVKPAFSEQDELTAEVLRLVRSAPLTDMRRRQIVYELRLQMGSAGLHVGTNDLFEFVDKIINRETAMKNGFVADRDGHTAHIYGLSRSVPPTGMRLSRILEQFRIHACSVGRQISPEDLRDFVEEVIRQDIQNQTYIER